MRIRIGTISIKLGTLLVIIIASIVLSGATIFSYIRIPRIWLCGLIGVLYFLYKRDSFILSTGVGKLFGIWLVFLFVNLQFSYTPINTRNAVIIFVSLFFLLSYKFEIQDMLLLYRIVRFFCIVFAISVIINAVVPSLMYGPLSGLVVFDTNTIREEVARNAYCGLVGDRNQTAFYMNIGLIFEIGLFNKNNRLNTKNKLIIILYIVALMLTGKRMLFGASMLLIAFSLWIFEIKGKWVKILMGGLVGIPVLLGIMQILPQTRIVFERLIENIGDDSLNGRKTFWDFCIYMFSQRPVIGYGYDSFNTALTDILHFQYRGQAWNMYAHSIYYELLGETGIIGFITFVGLQLSVFAQSIRVFKRDQLSNLDRMILFASMGVQLVFAVYGFSGNVLYQHCQLVFYIVALIMFVTILRRKKNYMRETIQ